MQSDLDDIKRSNKGFETENISLVKERNANLQEIRELTSTKDSLDQKLKEVHEQCRVLLEAKEIEAEKFNSGIEKLFTFKNQAKNLLAKN